MEWNLFHLHVGALAPHDRKMATSRLQVERVGFNRASWRVAHLRDTFLHTFLIRELHCCAGSFSAVLGPLSSFIIQERHGVENRLRDAL